MKHPRYRALILLSVFGTLRWGEVTALRRRELAPDGSWVRVAATFVRTSPRAALIYQNASRQVDQTIADDLSALIEGIASTAHDRDDDGEEGTPAVLQLVSE